MQQIVLASNNSGKVKEFKEIFKPLMIEIIPQSEFNVPEIDEPFNTFIENALHKARHCCKITQLPTLADDSGICVPGLDGAPGVFSARYAGIPSNDYNNNQKLIQELTHISDKSAYYYCVLVLVRNPNDPQPMVADGIVNGQIINSPQGSNGFGYDPHFYLPQFNKTMAELSPHEKNQISHRNIAIQELHRKISHLENLTHTNSY